MPPRSLKSICASVAFPAWVLGRDPTARIIAVSYAAELAGKHARDCRAVMNNAWYRRIFPRARTEGGKNTELEFETVLRGFRLGTSVGGTLTGRGGNFIIIDDPMKPDQAESEAERQSVNQWYDNTLYSRLDNKAEDVIILVMQRLHVDDLVAHVQAKEAWVTLNIPAIAQADEQYRIADDKFYDRKAGELLHPSREPQAALDVIKRNLGTQTFSAQYLQEPVPAGGAMVKWDWFRSYAEPPERGAGDFVTQSWDTASKGADVNSFSVCTTWLRRGADHYLLDVFRKRLEYPALKKQVEALAERWKPDAVLIEDKGSGTSLIQNLRQEGRVMPLPIQPVGDKIVRASAQSAKIEGGHVLLPEKASWLEDFRLEIMAFPHGRFDDQVDSVSQYLGWAHDRRMREAPIVMRYSTFVADLNYDLGWHDY